MYDNGLHVVGPHEVSPPLPLGDEVSRSADEDTGATSAGAVLLIEDDAAVINSLGEGLREEGLEVAAAQNGRDALDMLRDGLRPSFIVLDLMMPVMDGWDFRHEQLLDPALSEIPVVVITATGFSANTIRAQLGRVHVLPKPVPYLALLALVRRRTGPPAA